MVGVATGVTTGTDGVADNAAILIRVRKSIRNCNIFSNSTLITSTLRSAFCNKRHVYDCNAKSLSSSTLSLLFNTFVRIPSNGLIIISYVSFPAIAVVCEGGSCCSVGVEVILVRLLLLMADMPYYYYYYCYSW